MGKGIFKISIVLYMLALFTLIPLSAAQSGYYADANFIVGENGDTIISGLSNHPDLAAGTFSQFTSKKGDYWVFNFTINDEFLAYTYSVELPPNAEINYVKTIKQFRIGADAGKPFLKGNGENAPLKIIIQYTLGPMPATGFQVFGISGYTFVIVILVIIILIGILIYIWKLSKLSKEKNETGKLKQNGKNAEPEKKPWYNKALLPPRQKKIIEMLEETGKPITQKQIESHSSIPKSSLSRNIDALVKKGIIKKEPHGMANIIYINDEPPKPE